VKDQVNNVVIIQIVNLNIGPNFINVKNNRNIMVEVLNNYHIHIIMVYLVDLY